MDLFYLIADRVYCPKPHNDMLFCWVTIIYNFINIYILNRIDQDLVADSM